jgi:predicted ester cyclase
MGIPASGRQVTAHGMYMFRFAGDRIVEVWDSWDGLNVLQQLGA